MIGGNDQQQRTHQLLGGGQGLGEALLLGDPLRQRVHLLALPGEKLELLGARVPAVGASPPAGEETVGDDQQDWRSAT